MYKRQSQKAYDDKMKKHRIRNMIGAAFIILALAGTVAAMAVSYTHLSSDFEKESCLSEIFEFAKDNFYEFFGNEVIVT